MKPILVIGVTLLTFATADAQPSLSDQINAVDAVQSRLEAAERAAKAAQIQSEQRAESQRRAAAAVEVQKRRAEALLEEQKNMAAAAMEEQRKNAAEAQLRRKEEQELADKKRDQAYDDQLRALAIQERVLQIEREKARVARENDYIDMELKQKAASTDVIQSQADSSRDLSKGTKSFLERLGDTMKSEAPQKAATN